ncbi:hypothetical protein AV926_10445 [Myroides marinus]|uniref:Uncharacterized protein n=1 Tax=Myroides marinus TaxID=703342 RepID=A0A161S5X6_9FLAO|nr:hypothetical protein AS361_10735 [Myroides marinus]KZE80274.1 hypothetical protein AV926_10445 [Myroides marinus]
MIKQSSRVLRKTVSRSEQVLNSSAVLPKKLVYLILVFIDIQCVMFFKIEHNGILWTKVEKIGSFRKNVEVKKILL